MTDLHSILAADDAVQIGSKDSLGLFFEMEGKLSRQHKFRIFEGTVLCLDPGETTGYAYYIRNDGGVFDYLLVGQHKALTIHQFADWLRAITSTSNLKCPPRVIVTEDYRVYSWKANSHAWNSLFTPRVIGAMEAVAGELGIPHIKQSAQNAKHFATDDLLRKFGLYKATAGIRHGRDALRHLTYFLLCNHKNHYPNFEAQQSGLEINPEEHADL